MSTRPLTSDTVIRPLTRPDHSQLYFGRVSYDPATPPYVVVPPCVMTTFDQLFRTPTYGRLKGPILQPAPQTDVIGAQLPYTDRTPTRTDNNVPKNTVGTARSRHRRGTPTWYRPAVHCTTSVYFLLLCTVNADLQWCDDVQLTWTTDSRTLPYVTPWVVPSEYISDRSVQFGTFRPGRALLLHRSVQSCTDCTARRTLLVTPYIVANYGHS